MLLSAHERDAPVARDGFRLAPLHDFVLRRDIAFVIDEKISVSEIEKAIRDNGRPYLKEVRLFDQYIGKNIAPGKRSLAFSLAYQKDSGTFTDDEITALQQIVGETLKKDFQVEFR
jgi:phenylalanyl-tRNA synthetase beta chain